MCIQAVVKDAITEPMRDIATSHKLSVQLIRDTMTQLEACKLQLDVMRIETSRANHKAINTETSIGINRDLVKLHAKRVAELEAMLEEKQAEIKDLRFRLNG
ncbi:MAG: hypothetical protein DWQ04_07035 [Chloroflexi bacterium]|nr:MAG: hypothetical protein DWQ04_07035 [Chloroflexota bacterium]